VKLQATIKPPSLPARASAVSKLSITFLPTPSDRFTWMARAPEEYPRQSLCTLSNYPRRCPAVIVCDTGLQFELPPDVVNEVKAGE
jgi:hypothetical protein